MPKRSILASTLFFAVIAAVAVLSQAGSTQAQSQYDGWNNGNTLCDRLENYCNQQLNINARAEQDLRNAGRPMTLAYPGACQARDQVCRQSSSSSSWWYGSSRSSMMSSMSSTMSWPWYSSSSMMSWPWYSSSSRMSSMSSMNNGYPCGCPTDYAPVCGSDGRSYQNSCVAQCYNTDVRYNGLCGSMQNSSSSRYSSQGNTSDCSSCGNQPFSPVCGWNGNTYANACYANCYGTQVRSNTTCGNVASSSSSAMGGSSYPCGCSMTQDPVCGNDNRSYANSCVAQCYGAGVSYQGICRR